MAYGVTLDACVLYPMALCDLLLRMADAGFFRPVWSERILAEVERNLSTRLQPARVARRLEVMRRAFPEADADGAAFLAIVPDCVSEEDRHVVATALASRSELIVTANIRDMPPDCLAPLGVDIATPDEFLLDQVTAELDGTVDILVEQADSLRAPRQTVSEVVETLSEVAPEFARFVRPQLK